MTHKKSHTPKRREEKGTEFTIAFRGFLSHEEGREKMNALRITRVSETRKKKCFVCLQQCSLSKNVCVFPFYFSPGDVRTPRGSSNDGGGGGGDDVLCLALEVTSCFFFSFSCFFFCFF